MIGRLENVMVAPRPSPVGSSGRHPRSIVAHSEVPVPDPLDGGGAE
jgi:hypothetical protein